VEGQFLVRGLVVVIVLGKRVGGKNVTMYDVLDATAYVTPALEIIDYRTEVPRAIVDTIADNAAAAGMVTGGRPERPMDVDLPWCAATIAAPAPRAWRIAGTSPSSIATGSRSDAEHVKSQAGRRVDELAGREEAVAPGRVRVMLAEIDGTDAVLIGSESTGSESATAEANS